VVCSRLLRCALGGYEVAEVFILWLRHTLVKYEMAEVAKRWLKSVQGE
jgi:hypothetical protein